MSVSGSAPVFFMVMKHVSNIRKRLLKYEILFFCRGATQRDSFFFS